MSDNTGFNSSISREELIELINEYENLEASVQLLLEHPDCKRCPNSKAFFCYLRKSKDKVKTLRKSFLSYN